MRRNEAKRKLLRLFMPVAFCLIGAFSVQIRAEEAFVVEEEAIIGGGQTQEDAAPATAPPQRPEVLPPVSEKKPAAPKKSKTNKKTENKQQIEEEPEAVLVSENAVSQNHVATPFQVPVQKKETKLPVKKEGLDDKKETESRQQARPEEPEKEEVPEQSVPWWLPGAGGVFFLGGCARVVWRVVSRKNRVLGEK